MNDTAQEPHAPTQKPLPDKIVELICTYPGCTMKCGEVAFHAKHPIDVEKATHADLGIDDVRCDEHRI
jgi:hypothetical protein